MDGLVDKSRGEVSVPCVFSFVPVVQKLPFKNCLETTSGASQGKHHETTREAPSKTQLLTGVCSRSREDREDREDRSHPNTRVPPCDFVSGCGPGLSDRSDRTSLLGLGAMEAAPDKQQRHAPEVRLGSYFKSDQDRASPSSSADLFPTPASSRESILSACSDKDTSPVPDSRTMSPCSSVYSGMFTPSVVPVKKHFLAPGSSLISLPQSCRSSYESLSCPMSPTPSRHRPPLTRLSLLTAILRKGRLPVLSSSVQRPYTPCWPVNSVTLAHCSACSAASSVASIPLAFASEFSSSTSIDSQSEAYRGPSRSATAPPLFSKTTGRQNQVRTVQSSVLPRWQSVLSPPPQPVCSSIVKSVSPVNLHRSCTSKPPSLKPSFCLNLDHPPNNPLHPSPEPDTGVPRKWTRLPSSSFSKLQSLSQQLRTPPPGSTSGNVTPLPPLSSPSSPPPALLAHASPEPRPSPPRRTHTPATGRPSPLSPTPTPSPAPPPPPPPPRDLTPSPALSLRSTPSPRPGGGRSRDADREVVKRKPHKIKSSYKSLAAIPTNTLLLDQQVIDEQVDRADSSRDRGVPLDAAESDTHNNEVCSPAWLRKESEELYAVIDEILASTKSSKKSKSAAVKEAKKNDSTLPRTYGRETKYASVCSSSSNGNMERKADTSKTKPGVIRSVTLAPRQTTHLHEEKSEHSPFRHFAVSERLSDSTKGDRGRGPVGDRACGPELLREEEGPSGAPACDLFITEPQQHSPLPTKHGPPLGPSSALQRAIELLETQI